MGITLTIQGGLPTRVWDEPATRQLSQTAVGLFQARAFDEGRGVDGKPHPAYTPAYAKLRAKLGLQVTPPNLTRTGRLRRSLRVKWVTRRSAGIGLTGDAAVYGTFVGEKRPFVGASPKDRRVLRRAARQLAQDAIRRSIQP